MQSRILILGAVIIAVGLFLGYFPFQQPPAAANQTLNPTDPSHATLIYGPPPIALLNPALGYSARWSSASMNTLYVFDCGSSSTCAQWSVTNSTVVTSGNGTSGNLAWTGHPGQFFLLFATTMTSLQLGFSGPLLGGLIGWLVIGVGVVVLLAGMFLRPRTPAADTAPVASPTETKPQP